MPVSIHTDPIEKKPLYHFFPGRKIMSIGTPGCNLKCFYCQNCDISQYGIDAFDDFKSVNTSEIIDFAIDNPENLGLAFTYNEPTVYYEYMVDLALEIQKLGMKNVVVTNGFINEEPLTELIEIIDAFNIDLKGFTDKFYRRHTAARLAPVLESIKRVAASGKHLELTNLIIPGLNDNEDEFIEMLKWIKNETSEFTVLHLSRYFPRYKANIPPTTTSNLKRFYEIAVDYLKYVYIGNIENEFANDTHCHSCGEVVISRNGYRTNITELLADGKCSSCSALIIRNM
jgi:pyruvate formate lyase activating enzyme